MFGVMEISSLCDVGGGIGLWTREFIKMKGEKVDLSRIRCLDGSYVNRSHLLIPEECFVPTELENRIQLGDEKFDLVMTLEVAEHLSPERADSFVEDLTNLGDTILFSAAATGQGGTHHVNEEYMAYWVDKFSKRGYDLFDIIRPVIQNNHDVPFWYRQNVVVFVKRGSKNYGAISNVKVGPLIRVVCEEMYDRTLNYMNAFERERNDLRLKVDEIPDLNEKIGSLEADMVEKVRAIEELEKRVFELRAGKEQAESELADIKATRWYKFMSHFSRKKKQ